MQIEHVVSAKPIVSITEFTQHVVITTKSSQLVQLVVELVQMENPQFFSF
jgi:hypothetical protein